MFARRMKYIVIVNDGVEELVLFPQHIDHRDFTVRLDVYPVRAGFAFLCDGKLKCEGGSAGLNLESDPEKDTKLLNRQINFDFAAGLS